MWDHTKEEEIMADVHSQKLQDQNIFDLLGVTDGDQEQREKFLDELQQVIWEDFLEYDVELLLTKDELTELRGMVEDGKALDEQDQERLVEYLEGKIENLEEIMLDKALQLKGDMVRERVAGMKELFADDTAKLDAISLAENDLKNELWLDATNKLNTLSL